MHLDVHSADAVNGFEDALIRAVAEAAAAHVVADVRAAQMVAHDLRDVPQGVHHLPIVVGVVIAVRSRWPACITVGTDVSGRISQQHRAVGEVGPVTHFGGDVLDRAEALEAHHIDVGQRRAHHFLWQRPVGFPAVAQD